MGAATLRSLSLSDMSYRRKDKLSDGDPGGFVPGCRPYESRNRPARQEAIRIHIEEIPYEAVCLYGAFGAAVAFWRGGAERALVGAAVLAQLALSLRFELNPDVGLLIDAATLAICLTVALRGRGYWTLWAAASPVLSLATQMLRLWPGLTSWSYHSAQQAWFLALITALLVGALWPPRPAAMAATVDGHRP